MSEYLLIDGYNIINSWTDIFNVRKEPLEDLRDRLLTILSNYQGYRGIIILVVFDAHMTKGEKENIIEYDNLLVVYTKERETADHYIERFVYTRDKDDIVYVATSDYLEQRMVLHGGGVRITPRELREEILFSHQDSPKKTIPKVEEKNTLMANLDPETRKKLEKLRRKGT